MDYRLFPLGENAVMIELGDDIQLDTHHKVQMISSFLDHQSIEWMVEYIPAFTTVTIFYDPMKIIDQTNHLSPYQVVCDSISNWFTHLKMDDSIPSRVVEIPVCYGGEFGPDLEFVAKHNGLTIDEVITIHASGDYIVYMIGFAPGFPYIGGMSEKILAPRRQSPRLKIPAGTVGIAGKQTGVYPIETPGGWQLIGKTPLKLFRPQDNPPSLLKAGDKIRFIPISCSEYKELEDVNND
ncbi:5-oxoprolinase subunit PxpB [Bacillus litorisediminis]|uniref:5-oxoprolinase subunit PxpB n=1 Tax=Bacillus litorisediminis TaxID=2922713 RepID=UPI002434FFEB|nr:5-oxoprolinase subunit PxpB [Bacillus litorisediminis]